MKIRPVLSENYNADRQTEANRRFSQFCEHA